MTELKIDWRKAIDDARLSLMLDITAPDANPATAVKELVSWANELALNPAISPVAQALIDRGLAMQAERHREELDAYALTVANLKQDRDTWAERCASEVAKVANLDQQLERDAKRRDEELLAYEVTVSNLRSACDLHNEAAIPCPPERDIAEERRAEFHEEMRRDAFGDRA
jgi:hypothetical protein